MIIHTPEKTTEKDEILLISQVESKYLPNKTSLWYAFPSEQDGLISEQADGFLAPMVLKAMSVKESIEVRGPVSPQLAFGLEEFQKIFNFWFPKLFQRIRINYKQLTVLEPTATVTAQAFSGGADSFHTLWSHSPENKIIPDFQVKYAVFVHGFDIPLCLPEDYQEALRVYREILSKLGVSLIQVRTNVRQLTEPISWDHTHGGALIGVALTLQKGISRFLVPSSKTYISPYPWGSHFMTDHLFSTEVLKICHVGASLSRLEKIIQISHWEPTYSGLRVCWKQCNGVLNCCRCSKCLQTMVVLETAGVLNKYKTFPLGLRRADVRKINFLATQSFTAYQNLLVRQLGQMAKDANRDDLCRDLKRAKLKSIIKAAGYSVLKPLPDSVKKRLAPFESLWKDF